MVNTWSFGCKFVEEIVNTRSPVVKDLYGELKFDCSNGTDQIVCFYSDSRGKDYILNRDEYCKFEDIIVEEFPFLDDQICCPYGVYLTKSEVEKIKVFVKDPERLLCKGDPCRRFLMEMCS